MLTTKHAKARAIARPFLEKLGANVIEYVVDTDILGAFSGEIHRELNALECARKKCEWSLHELGDSVEFALASEGSFGPHPIIPFIPCDQEILYFIDRKRDLHLHMTHISEKTNYRTAEIESLDSLRKFACAVKFPSHALIVRPFDWQPEAPIFKGLHAEHELESAFNVCRKYSDNGTIWVETDMRPHCNPSRMNVINELATKLAERLAKQCPQCNNPGWGPIRYESGLPCSYCKSETELLKLEIIGCVKCDYVEKMGRSDRKKEADPIHCPYCNP